jgi:hypothetical protein
MFRPLMNFINENIKCEYFKESVKSKVCAFPEPSWYALNKFQYLQLIRVE